MSYYNEERKKSKFPSSMAKNSFFCLYEIGRCQVDQNYQIFSETKNNFSVLFCYTLKGKGQLEYRNNVYTLKPGTVFAVNCKYPLIYRTAGDSWEFLWLHAYSSITYEYFNILEEQGKVVRHGCNLFEQLWDELFELSDSEYIDADIKISLVICKIFTLLMTNDIKDPRIIKLIQYIEEHYSEKITLDELADLISVSKYYLLKLFKKETGNTPYKYLTQYRMSKAKKLLCTTNLTVEEIGLQVGCEDVTHFMTLFRKYVGTSPTKYRLQSQISLR